MVSKKRVAVICAACSLVCFLLGAYATTWLLFGSGDTRAVLSQQQYKSWQQLRLLNEIYGIIQTQYYQELPPEEIIKNAAKSLMYSTGDRYAAYYTKEEYEQLVKQNAGEYYGLGISIRNVGDKVVISEVYDDAPAQKAGLLPGDVLLFANADPMEGMSLEEVRSLLASKNDRPVTITVDRAGELKEFVVNWEVVHSPKGKSAMIGDVMYLRLYEFNGDCVEVAKSAVSAAKRDNARGIVVDLRGNPGGDLEKVIEVSKLFIGKGVILTIRDRYDKVETYESSETPIGMPIAVLINGESASASEVFSGAVKDHGVGTLVGEKTFGKGIVQTWFALKTDGGHVKLTTSTYFTPSGQCIHGVGIEPDVEAHLDEGEYFGNLDPQDDNQLQAALQLLQK